MNFTFKLWPSLVAIFMMVTSFQAKAQTLLPHFATSDQYGGKKVDEMSNFVPILDDYTLEVMGTIYAYSECQGKICASERQNLCV